MSLLKPVFIDLNWERALKVCIKLKPLHAYYINPKTEIIPLIIVPGFMGTKLYTFLPKKHKKVTIWDPDASLSTLYKYGGNSCSPKKRKDAFIGGDCFNPNYLSILNYHNSDNPYLHDCISKDFYGYLIKELSKMHSWSNTQQYCFELPVYSFPYNWTDDNANSAEKLNDYVEKIINSYQAKAKRCQRVILITHSMGGLVARYACKKFMQDKTLGVIHVAQPANGAASTFWRIKCGFERGGDGTFDTMVNGKIADTLGPNSEALTAVLANMPAGLQTLPNCEYKDNQGHSIWLRFVDENNQPFNNEHVQHIYGFTDLPKYGDPYEEIYKKFDKCYYLVKLEYLHPEGLETNSKIIEAYLKNVDKAKEFHNYIQGYSHPVTFNIYGNGIKYPTVDKIPYQVRLSDTQPLDMDIARESLDHLVNNLSKPKTEKPGEFKRLSLVDYKKFLELTLRKADAEGDGTVSISSGQTWQCQEVNVADRTQYIANLKHDAALSGSDDPSKKCIDMIINNIKSILNQQITIALADPRNSEIIEPV